MDSRYREAACIKLASVFERDHIAYSMGFPTLVDLLYGLVHMFNKYFRLKYIVLLREQELFNNILKDIIKKYANIELLYRLSRSVEGEYTLLIGSLKDVDTVSVVLDYSFDKKLVVLFTNSLCRELLQPLLNRELSYIVVIKIMNKCLHRYRHVIISPDINLCKHLPGVYYVCGYGYTSYKLSSVRGEHSGQLQYILDYSIPKYLLGVIT